VLPSRKEKKKIAEAEPKEKVMSSKQKKRLDKFIVKDLFVFCLFPQTFLQSPFLIVNI